MLCPEFAAAARTTILSEVVVELMARAEGEGEATGADADPLADADEEDEFEEVEGTSPFAISIKQYPP